MSARQRLGPARKSADELHLVGQRHLSSRAAFLIALTLTACGGRAKDERASSRGSSTGGASTTAPSGGSSSGGQSGSGGTSGSGGADTAAGAGGSLGGSFESADFVYSCRYVECEGCFRCIEFYEPFVGCGLPVSGTTQEVSENPCPREGLSGVCIRDNRVSYSYFLDEEDLEWLEESCNSIGTFVRP